MTVYNATKVNSLDETTPTAQTWMLNEVDDAIREIKKCIKNEIFFHKKVTLTSAAGATAVNIITNADIPGGKKCYIMGFFAYVNGATPWATVANVVIQDTAVDKIDFVTIGVAALTANAKIFPHTTNVTLEDAVIKGTGGTLDKGLQIKANTNGTGSDLIAQVWGVIKS